MNTENKTGFLLLPNGAEISQALKSYAPTGIAIGAGTAGLVNLLAELRRNRQQQVSKSNSEVLEVQIPSPQKKEANGPGLWANIRAKRKRGEKPAKPGQEGYPDKKNWKELTSESKEAGFVPAGVSAPILGAIRNIVENVGQAAKKSIPITAGLTVGTALAGAKGVGKTLAEQTPNQNPLWQAPLDLAALVVPAAGAYAGVNSVMSSLRKKREEERLQNAQNQYSKLLGQELIGTKTAEFPLCEEVVRVLAGSAAAEFNVSVNGITKIAQGLDLGHVLSIGTSSPTLLAVLAAVASHKYMYDREQAAIAGAKMAPTRIKPPSQIRLVSAPAQVDEKVQDTGDLPAESAEKTAGIGGPVLTAASVDLTINKLIANKLKEKAEAIRRSKINPETGMPFEKKVHTEAKQDFVDANTLVVNTPTGATVIDAADPAALKVLQEKQKEIAQRMEAASVLPTNSTNF
jgi:hypothetical protein